MQLPHRYTYNPRWTTMGACALFFAAVAAFMGYKAWHNERGLIINGIITLGPSGATAFYWAVAGSGALFVIAAILLVVRRVANPQTLELMEDALLLPHGFLQTHTTRIPYADIKRVWEVQISGQTFLYVATSERKVSIVASMLPDAESYRAVKDFMHSRAVPVMQKSS